DKPARHLWWSSWFQPIPVSPLSRPLAHCGLRRQYGSNFITHGGCSDFVAIPRRHQFDRYRVRFGSTLWPFHRPRVCPLDGTVPCYENLTKLHRFFSASFHFRSAASNRLFVVCIARSRGDCVLHVSAGGNVALGLRGHRHDCTLSECFRGCYSSLR